MYQNLVRNVLKSYLSTGAIPAIADLGLEGHSDLLTKNLVFVTLYLDGAVVASSGRVYALQNHTISECIDNSLLALKDARAVSISINNLDTIRIRVDIIQSTDRRVIRSFSEMNPREEGVLLLSQNLGKLAVVLPKILPPDITAEEIFKIACIKADMSTQQDAKDYVLFAIRSTQYSDF